MYTIEVATPSSASTKEKGDLLERVASELLQAQSYDVVKEIRVTASELDLLCQHKVSKKRIYVECKAHRDPLSAEILTKLYGTVLFHKHQEGWLISTGPLGKDAKGFQQDWEARLIEESQKLSIYTPERVLEAFINAGIIQSIPKNKAAEIVEDEDLLGEWTLFITPYGKHWAVTTLRGGVPTGVLVFSAKTGKIIEDTELLLNLSNTDTSLRELDFDFVFHLKKESSHILEDNNVIEVQQGDSWADYRPARPEDFVGREEEQNQLFHFLEDVRQQESRTRVFAITGDSGMGKSSLIAKLRDRSTNQRYRSKFFLYAVDVRAATHATYIYSALLVGLSEAVKNGFGMSDGNAFKIGNPSTPLSDPSIQTYLTSLEQKQEIVCVIFDQFEELYSKTELFSVFEAARLLFLATVATRSNLVLGFAWKTDSTVQQNHPAYYLWHQLADHRIEVQLHRFTHSEVSSAITIFEKQLEGKLRSALRRQLIENSQGYPWLLKKLSIHIYDQIKAGISISQFEIMNKAYVESLFNRDLQQLSKAEETCLKMIARTAPADWYEVLEAFDHETLRGLQQKRLIIRSGDRINLYWDIFREYVLTGTVPSIPLTYLPASPSVRTMLAIAQLLEHSTYMTHSDLGSSVGISEKSVGNIVRDLIMFGIATGEQSQVTLSDEMETSDPKEVLRKLRRVLKHHALTIGLKRFDNAGFVTLENMIEILQEINPAAQHQKRTWRIYTERIGQLLAATGYLIPAKRGWKLEDRGEESINPTNAQVRRYYTRHPKRYRENTLFIGDTSPYQAVRALEWLISEPPHTWQEIEGAGYRNGARTLLNLRLIINQSGRYVVSEVAHNAKSLKEIVWETAQKEPVMELVITYLKENPSVMGEQVGKLVAENYERDWTPTSLKRIGGGLHQWATWLIQGSDNGVVPDPPGRKPKNLRNNGQQLGFL